RYDGRGNLTGVDGGPAASAQYAYDAADRLITASEPDGTNVTNLYNVDGLRVQQSVGSQTTHYLWDEASRYGDVVLETDGSNTTSYVYGGAKLISQTRNDAPSYYLQDGHGSVRSLTDAAGSLTDSYDYSAFGETLNHTGSSANPYQYTGQQFDAQTGLYDLRARYYDPGVGQFLSQDTNSYNINDPAQLNRYTYTANNPVNFIDPLGLQAFAEYTFLTQNDEEAAAAAEGEAYAEEGDALLDETGGSCPINSFSADTQVATQDGEKPISEIQIGDYVLAWNAETGEISFHPVTDTIHHTDQTIVKLTIDDETLTATPEHLFYVEGKGWVNAKDLQVGDAVRKANGSAGKVKNVKTEQTTREMYNLTVKDAHTYYVGKGQWLVHNAGICNPRVDVTKLLDANTGHPTPNFDPDNCWHCAVKSGLDPNLEGVPRDIFTNWNQSHVVLKVAEDGVETTIDITADGRFALLKGWGAMNDPVGLNLIIETLGQMMGSSVIIP
ncbi:MAG: polymorphic toxin-type HINT domain-containing protein, partial [Anaerolineales bacterium]